MTALVTGGTSGIGRAIADKRVTRGVHVIVVGSSLARFIKKGANRMSLDVLVGVGRPMPDVTLPDLDGRSVRLADFRGKKLLVFVWGSW